MIGHHLVDVRITSNNGRPLVGIREFEGLLAAIGDSCPALRRLALENFCFPHPADARDLTKGLRPLSKCELIEELLVGTAHPFDNCPSALPTWTYWIWLRCGPILSRYI
jgi:hypothetical protein